MMSLFSPSNSTKQQGANNPKRAQIFIVTAVILAALVACATTGLTPAQKAQLDAFNGLKTIRASVVAAVGVFNVGYQTGQFNEGQRTSLGALYNKYLAADAVAATALQATTTTDPTTIVQNVTVLAADVLRFIQLLKPSPTTFPTTPAVHP